MNLLDRQVLLMGCILMWRSYEADENAGGRYEMQRVGLLSTWSVWADLVKKGRVRFEQAKLLNDRTQQTYRKQGAYLTIISGNGARRRRSQSSKKNKEARQ